MTSALQPGLSIIHGNRIEDLRQLVVDWVRMHPLAPLETETVVVFSNGIAEWLKLALASDQHGLGVASALDIQLPSRFLWQAYRAVLGPDAVPKHSPLDKDALTWRLMRLLPSLATQDEFAALAQYLADDATLTRRHQLAGKLADLFDQYQVYRADWLADWAIGQNRLTRRGTEYPVPADLAWQPALWRALLTDVGQATPGRSTVHTRFVQTLCSAERSFDDLPRRVIVFGLSALPQQAVEALAAMASQSQVLLLVTNPCRYYWGDIVEDRALLAQRHRHARKAGTPVTLTDELVSNHAHPLLAAWGKQGRDYINLLDQFDPMQERIDVFESPDTTTLLHQLQDDILELRPLSETRSRWPVVDAERDESIRFHVAHSRQREVEILHDQLLARFAADPTLSPRDVIVMVPDIDAYAPHIDAVFGQIPYSDPRYLPYTLSDRASRARAPVLLALDWLLTLPEARCSYSEMFDLIETEAVARRFGIEDAAQLGRWLAGAGVRWGLEPAQRARFGMPDDIATTSWRAGLDRMLLGYMSGRGGEYAGITPYDEIGGLNAALIGPLYQLVDALDATRTALATPQTPHGWARTLSQLLDTFFDGEEELMLQLGQELQGWLTLCDDAGLVDALPLGVVREAWLSGLDRGGLSQRFFAGSINCCTLMPMRAIPFRIVCLLGLDDGAYPRVVTPLDFDLMAGDYRPGDRSRRDDDRYLLLEALLCARDTLLVSWIGRNVRDNTALPPSTLIAQLRDHLDAGWRTTAGGKVSDSLSTEHPLQPFSPSYFDGERFSYAHEWLAVHAAPVQTGGEALAPFVPEAPITLAVLARFLRDPVRTFFTDRLKARLEPEDIAELDDEVFALAPLARVELHRTLLEHGLQDKPPPRLVDSGLLPLAGFGQLAATELANAVDNQIARYGQLREHAAEEPLQLVLHHEETSLEDRVICYGDKLISLPASTITDKKGAPLARKLIAPWLTSLAASACGHRLTVHVVAPDATVRIDAIDAASAREQLCGLMALWREGMRRPLPLSLRAGIEAAQEADEARVAAAYSGSDHSAGDLSYSPALARAFPDFTALTTSGEFDVLARQAYGALVTHPMSAEKADARS
ncbi:exodeoxyribonuclease V subunit gamma [Chitinibacteraceae bacterium HSL-7]